MVELIIIYILNPLDDIDPFGLRTIVARPMRPMRPTQAQQRYGSPFGTGMQNFRNRIPIRNPIPSSYPAQRKVGRQNIQELFNRDLKRNWNGETMPETFILMGPGSRQLANARKLSSISELNNVINPWANKNLAFRYLCKETIEVFDTNLCDGNPSYIIHRLHPEKDIKSMIPDNGKAPDCIRIAQQCGSNEK